jgi:3-methyladenine DNA glycosylase/8-oxoguanine DNA glycosylase
MTSAKVSKPVDVPVAGPFDLQASTRFLEGFAPAARPDAASEPGLLRLAFPAEAGWTPVGAEVRQHGPTVTIALAGDPPAPDAFIAQVVRILSLDIDGRGFPEIGRRDPVVGKLQARYPGLRPVLFHSPYEAACWAIIGQRIRITQAATIKTRIADQLGTVITVAGQKLASFPAPQQLKDHAPAGLPDAKVARLHAIADAALDGRLDAGRLRSLDTTRALDELTQLSGIGPFSAQLILARGAGHPDMFPTAEPRLHEEIARSYALDQPTLDQLSSIADGWRPYRTWIGLLMRTRREDETHEINRGHRTHR